MTPDPPAVEADIAIVDTDTNRGRWLASLLTEAGMVVLHFNGASWQHGRRVVRGQRWVKLATLVHHADQDVDPGADGSRRIFFTGGDPSLAQGDWIRRPILEGSITLMEANELCTWLDQGGAGEKPALLSGDGRRLTFFTALAILCQAFLCREAATTPQKEGAALQALAMMGWKPSSSGSATGLSLAAMSAPAWWRAGLGMDRGATFVAIPASVRAVRELLGIISEDGGQVSADLVGASYKEIVQQLESMG